MSLLKTIKPEEANPEIKFAYDELEKTFQKVPNVFQFFTANPHFFFKQVEYLNYFRQHPNLDFIFFAMLRLVISVRRNGEYCVRLNSAMLKYMGYTQQQLDEIITDPSKVNFEENKKALFLLALKVENDSGELIENDLIEVRNYGWSDSDIFDACYHASIHSANVKMNKNFKVEIDF